MIRSIFFIALCVWIAGPVYAQSDSLAVRPSTLRECLRLGLEQNYSIRLVKNEQQMSDNEANPAFAGLLPSVDVTGSYGADLGTTKTVSRATGSTETVRDAFDQDVDAKIQLSWTIFDGFDLWTNYRQLQLLKKQGELQTRIAVEDFIASLTAEYYNFIQQKIRLKNFRYAVKLSKERMRIVEERYHIGNFSRLDYQQAKVDFNADSAAYMKQQEALVTSRIRLNELMANSDVNELLPIADSTINVMMALDFDFLWNATLAVNADLLKAGQDEQLAQMDLKKVLARNYPYVKFSGGYGYTFNKYGRSSTRRRDNWGLSTGITVGFSLFDGKRATDRKNARLELENAHLQRANLELSLRADINNLWQAYQNNVQMLELERQNLIAAVENHEIASERYLLGDLSGFEMREAQKSLLDAEERILTAEYDTKMCEISLLQLSGNIMMYLR